MTKSSLIKGLTVDKGSYIPIYVQLKEILKGLIHDEKIKPNEIMPSENELSTAFGISRITVRQAIAELAREGYLFVKRGRGTFAGSVPGSQMLFKLDGFSAEMSKLGYHTHSKVLEAGQVDSFEEYRSAYTGLREHPENAVVRIKRVRYLEDAPFAIETSFLRRQHGAPLLERGRDQTLSIYGYLEKELKIVLSRAEHTIEPHLAPRDAAQLLGIKQGSPVLVVKGTTYSDKNVPIEYLEGTYRGDKYKLKVEIRK